MGIEPPLYGPRQSRFARYLERRSGGPTRWRANSEPDATARAAATQRARDAAIPIDVVDGDAVALPAEDGGFDAAVVVWVLCSFPDPAAALRELRRVLRPGGELRFYEHVRSPHAVFRGLQRAADALFWTRALGGCETTRDTPATVAGAGFETVALERGFHSSSLLTISSAPYVRGTARSPAVKPH